MKAAHAERHAACAHTWVFSRGHDLVRGLLVRAPRPRMPCPLPGRCRGAAGAAGAGAARERQWRGGGSRGVGGGRAH
eukprot:10701662-Alexandrium_andersonii.AAC.1